MHSKPPNKHKTYRSVNLSSCESKNNSNSGDQAHHSGLSVLSPNCFIGVARESSENAVQNWHNDGIRGGAVTPRRQIIIGV